MTLVDDVNDEEEAGTGDKSMLVSWSSSSSVSDALLHAVVCDDEIDETLLIGIAEW